jgi:hypothetical protein
LKRFGHTCHAGGRGFESPSLPLFKHRFSGGFCLASEKERREGFHRAHSNDTAVVEPDALEDQLKEFPLRLAVFLDSPEDAEVVEETREIVSNRTYSERCG